jgi:hypothetical protein
MTGDRNPYRSPTGTPEAFMANEPFDPPINARTNDGGKTVYNAGESPMTATAVAMQPAVPEVTHSGNDAELQMLERMSLNPAIDIDKFERLVAMRDRRVAQLAKNAFVAAFVAVQSELPVIERKGMITVKKEGRLVHSTPYAQWADINEIIKPILGRHGLALWFKTNTEGERLTITAILGHVDGHIETNTVPLPLDRTGSKNENQAVGSTLTYGQRYAATGLLNLTSRAEDQADKDGNGDAKVREKASEEQIKVIRDKITDKENGERRLLTLLKLEKLEDLFADKVGTVIGIIESKKPITKGAK